MPKWLFALTHLTRQLWIRVALFSLLGLAAALAAVLFAPFVPDELALTIGTEAVDQMLTILASSMLAVATFSLATLVTAYTAVSQSATPRAAALIVADGRGQSALATFVGAFVYGVVGIFALQTGYYGSQGRVILFLATVAVLGLVVLALVRWIDQLAHLGQVAEAVDRVARATRTAFEGSSGLVRGPAPAEPDEATVGVDAQRIGYVRNIDLAALEGFAREHRVTIHVAATPGTFVHPGEPLFRIAGRAAVPTAAVSDMRAAFVVGDRRTYDQDPVYGFAVLGEIAAKALSPAVNDPGTAIDVVAAAVRLLGEWARSAEAAEAEAAGFDGVRFPPLAAETLLDAVFTPVALYGAGDPMVGERLQHALAALAALGDEALAAAARAHSARALERSLEALSLEHDRTRVRAAAARLDPAPR